MKRFSQWFDLYFHCSRRERNGIFALAVLSSFLLLSAWTYQTFLIRPQEIDFSRWETAMAQITKDSHNAPNDIAAIPIKSEFPFNPNIASADDLAALGLDTRTIKSIVNYRSKGGQFRQTEDFRKIYTLSNEDYERLRPFLRFETQDKKQQDKKVETPSVAVSEPFLFNPNTADIETLQRLGLSEKTAYLIVNYRSKGGQFRSKNDLAKIYGMQPTDFERLHPYIELPDSIERKKPIAAAFQPTNGKNPNAIIDINTATVEQWTQLRGIGTATAQRIVKFREALGGFVQVNQVAEVYGLPDSTFQKIRPQLTYSSFSVQKININTASEEQMKQHPYLKFRHIKAILKYREKSGKITDLNLLQTWVEFDDGEGTFQKLRPYLVL